MKGTEKDLWCCPTPIFLEKAIYFPQNSPALQPTRTTSPPKQMLIGGLRTRKRVVVSAVATINPSKPLEYFLLGFKCFSGSASLCERAMMFSTLHFHPLLQFPQVVPTEQELDRIFTIFVGEPNTPKQIFFCGDNLC